MTAWLKSEIVLLMALVQAVLALVIAFGVNLTADQTGAILAVSAAILGVLTRSQVSPKSSG